MRSITIFIAAAGLFASSALAEPIAAPTAPADLAGFIRQQMAEAGIVGLGAAVIVDREVAFIQASVSPTGSAPNPSPQTPS
jgi:hypothetical protein